MNITQETNQLEVLSCNFSSKNTPPTKERKFYFSSDLQLYQKLIDWVKRVIWR